MDAERNPVGKAAPVFALAYCHRDADAAARWLAWVAFLAAEKEPTVRHDLVVMRTRRMAGAKIEQLVPGVRVTHAVCPDEDERGYPGSATHLFIRTLEFCNARFPGRPVMFMESDTVAMRPGWMDEIAAEYADCGKPFMGFHVDNSTCPHMTGCGVYPANWRALSPILAGILEAPRDSAIFGKDKGQAWDIYAASEVEPQMARSRTIQQIWRPGFWLNSTTLNRIAGETAFFHQDKEGSLIRLLSRERFGRRFIWRRPEGVVRYFMLESPQTFLVDGGERVAEFTKIARSPSGYLSILKVEDPDLACLLHACTGTRGLTEVCEGEYQALLKQAPRH